MVSTLESGDLPSPTFAFGSETGGADRLSDRATEKLRSLIITLQLEPGAILDEVGLSRRLGFGRTPLRQAIQRLADEGLAVILPRRAVAVAQITVTDLQQVYEARLAFESASARFAATRATPAALERIAQYVASLKSNLTEGADVVEVVHSDFNFHYAIAAAAENRYVSEGIRRLLGLAMRLTYVAHRHGQPVQETFTEHAAVVDALRQRDPDTAEQAIRHHISSAKERILNRL